MKKFCLGCKNLNDQVRSGRPKIINSKVIFQVIEANLASSTHPRIVFFLTKQFALFLLNFLASLFLKDFLKMFIKNDYFNVCSILWDEWIFIYQKFLKLYLSFIFIHWFFYIIYSFLFVLCRLSCRGVRLPPLKKKCPGYDTKLHLMVRLLCWSSVKYPFIPITPRFTWTWSGSTC